MKPIARAISLLEAAQRPDGEFRVLASTDPTMATGCVEDPSVFPNAVIAQALARCGSAAARMRERLNDYLLGEVDARGLWRHWPRGHPQQAQLPPDLDDTSCASSALAEAGRAFPDNRALLLANRAAGGLFYTWLCPRLRWTERAHRRAALVQLRHPLTLWLFFRRTSAAPGDVDAVVNANVLFYFGARAETAPVIDHLLDLLRNGRECQCDKWYEDPFVVRYFLSRALARAGADVGGLIVESSLAQAPASALQAAMAICSLADWGRAPPPALLGMLLDLQRPDGSWPRAALYHGGRARRRDGGFDPPHPDTPRWGSEELTTALCIEALARTAGTRR